MTTSTRTSGEGGGPGGLAPDRALVSVICPAYDRGPALTRTLDSVLGQSHGRLELLVGDDGSTDDTREVVRAAASEDPRVRLLELAHHGDPGPVRARLLAEARGSVIAYVDHDDTWSPDHLARSLESLAELPPDTVHVAGASYTEPTGGHALSRHGGTWDRTSTVLDPLFEPTRVVHRAGLLRGRDGWRPSYGGMEDWDLWWRLSGRGTRFHLDDAVTVTIPLTPTTRRNRLRFLPTLTLATVPDRTEATEAVERWARAHAQPGTELPAWLSLLALPTREGWTLGFGAPVVTRRHAQEIRRLLPTPRPHLVAEATEALTAVPAPTTRPGA